MPNETQVASEQPKQPPVEKAEVKTEVAVTPPLKGREAFYQTEGLAEKPKEAAQAPAPKPEETLKPPETPPAPTPDKAQEPPAPKLYAGKFKSFEELERGYKELESLTSKKNAEINKALKEVSAATRQDKTLTDALVSKSDDEAPDPLLDPSGYREYIKKDVMQTFTAQQQAERIRESWRVQNEDILDLEPLVSFRLFSDPRVQQANNLEAVAELINEHTAYARGLATKYREAGRKEIQTKLESIPPSAPQNSIEGPPQAETTQPQDDVSDFVGLRNRMRMGRPLMRSRG